MRRPLAWCWIAICAGCAHASLMTADLERIHRPAFVSRIEENAGPRARVFEDDGAPAGRLKRLEPKEADRRLQVKLTKVVTRFQLSDGLRAALFALLPQEPPWTHVVPPADVATTLESFLVEEVPANTPDYDLLRRLGADSVLELVVQDFGMRSVGGGAHPFLRGYARLFLLDGPELWRREFARDAKAGEPELDPFEVGKSPELYRDALGGLVESVAEELARALQPASKGPAAPAPEAAPPPAPPAAPEPPRQPLPEDSL